MRYSVIERALGFARIAAVIFLAAGSAALAQHKHPGVRPDAGVDLYGTILDDAGAPVAGVVVSDGYQCVATDARGVYQMKRHPKARMVHYSTPSEFAIGTIGGPSSKGGSALFYAPLKKETKRYNFDLARLPAPEKDFTLVCVGDPQARYDNDLKRYENETIADLRAFAKGSALPVYAVLLGDIGFDMMHLLEPMRRISGMAEIPYFAVIGNHDHDKAINDDYESGAAFENIFGPLNYSFNRGDVHVIGMDNVLYQGGGKYTCGFTDEQIEWLRQNLSFVPKGKTIVLAYHIPLRDTASYKNRAEALGLLKGYADVHLMAGHTHYHENYMVKKPVAAYEHIHATACGAWWRSTLNTDGAPNGYASYTFNGNKVADWYYKAVNYTRDHQLRMYRGDASFGGPGGTFTYGKTANDIVVDVWNADPKWKLAVYENGVAAGRLKKLPQMVDAYAAGFHVGVLKRNAKSYAAVGRGVNKHLYMHTLKDPNARVEIRATDRFGKTYSQTEFTTDLSVAEGYKK